MIMSPHNQSPISRSVGGWMTTITTTTRRRKETGIIRDTDLPVYWPSGNGTCPWSLHSSLCVVVVVWWFYVLPFIWPSMIILFVVVMNERRFCNCHIVKRNRQKDTKSLLWV